MMNKRRLGKEFEEMASAYLTKKGYRIVEANFWCRTGEIDLIAKDGNYLVFIEVKYRKDSEKGTPLEAVDFRKIKNITRVSRYYLYKNQISEDQPCRFDVVSIMGKEITLIQNAFDAYIG
jgi:putative endonuclease